MNVDFGKVNTFFTNKGFGFITHNFFLKRSSELFFHITTIQKSNIDIANKINNGESDIYFWYEFKRTLKGEQVTKIIEPKSINKESLEIIIPQMEKLWLNISKPVPSWLEIAGKDLLEINKLNEKRERLKQIEHEKIEAKMRSEIEKIRIKLERDKLLEKRWEERRRKKALEVEQTEQVNDTTKIIQKSEKISEQQKIEEQEFQQLVKEIRPLGFSQSSQISNYIVKNQLGFKYQNISGILEMEKDGDTWSFKGGFPPRIYARLCEELGLENKGTRSKPVTFTPFKDL